MTAVITALREATGPAHRALEAALDPDRLCTSRARYVGFIAALHGFHLRAEVELADLVVPDLPPVRRRSALLATDLLELGVDPVRVPVMPPFLGRDEDGARHGVLYVVEGSALGGTVLARLVREHLGLGPTDGAAFLGAGAANAGRWREVKLALERDVVGAQVDAAARAARTTFTALAAWMHEQRVSSGTR